MEKQIINIEVYEWKEGHSRPGSVNKHRHDCIEILDFSENDPVPNINDILLLIDPKGTQAQYRVISREISCSRPSNVDSLAHPKFQKIWIHVRAMNDKEYEGKP